jgi:fluoroacetyl-CoA thioesterase
MMVALTEEAACNCIAAGLEAGQSSVGTQINISHTSASPIGAKITATAVIERVFGRRIEFKVSASDGIKEIGSGTHTRMIIDADKFVSGLKG